MDPVPSPSPSPSPCMGADADAENTPPRLPAQPATKPTELAAPPFPIGRSASAASARSPSFTDCSSSLAGGSSSANTAVSAASAASAASRARGYRRPIETHFSRSALNRQSVMCLGSIAHLQYYYARTGKLDGKGGQLAKPDLRIRSRSPDPSSGSVRIRPPRRAVSRAGGPARSRSSLGPGPMPSRSVSAGQPAQRAASSLGTRQDTLQVPTDNHDMLLPNFDDTVLLETGTFCEEPEEDDGAVYEDEDEYDDDQNDDAFWDEEMLPPTVSTYNYPRRHIEPPPDLKILRKQLMDALENCSVMLELLAAGENLSDLEAKDRASAPDSSSPSALLTPPVDAEFEQPAARQVSQPAQAEPRPEAALIEDTVREATGAVREYYTKHSSPEHLLAVTSAKDIRLGVLRTNTLVRRIVDRSIASPTSRIQPAETALLQKWTYACLNVLGQELEQEQRANQKRKTRWRNWMNDAVWQDTLEPRDRELDFLTCMLESNSDTAPSAQALKEAGWAPIRPDSPDAGPGPIEDPAQPTSVAPTTFLRMVQSGVLLVHLHNAAVQASKNKTGRITDMFATPDRPFRRSHNLRYWAKAAELRWALPVGAGPDGAAGMQLDLSSDIGEIARVALSGDEATKPASPGFKPTGSTAIWRRLDEAILLWSKTVRIKLTEEWGPELQVRT